MRKCHIMGGHRWAACARRSLSVGVSCVLNVAAGFAGLALVSLPMFSCIRRTASLFVMIMEWAVLSKVYPASERCASRWGATHFAC